MACDETHTAENFMFFGIGFCIGFAIALMWMIAAGYLRPLPMDIEHPAAPDSVNVTWPHTQIAEFGVTCNVLHTPIAI